MAAVLVTGSEKATSGLCDGRMVTIMWLALNWLPDPVKSLSNVRLDDSVTGSAIVLSPTEPTTPKVTSARAAELLGVKAPKEKDKCD